MTFGRESTTDEVLEGIDLSGRHALVTGASAGLGVETTRALAAHGAKVTMAVRDLAKARGRPRRHPRRPSRAPTSSCGSSTSPRWPACGRSPRVPRRPPTLDLFIGNAGRDGLPAGGTTVDGFELQFGTNHLGHFLLARDAAAPARRPRPARGRCCSARPATGWATSTSTTLGSSARPYDPWIAYGRSKTANVLTAVALDHRLLEHGSQAFAVHPGGIVTELGRHLTKETLDQMKDFRPPGVEIFWKSVPQGAATTCYAATSPDLDGQRAWYLEDCHVADDHRRSARRRGRPALRPRPRSRRGALGALRAARGQRLMRFTYAEAMTDPTFYKPLAQAAEAAGFDGFLVPDSICYPFESDAKYPYTPDGNREFIEDKAVPRAVLDDPVPRRRHRADPLRRVGAEAHRPPPGARGQAGGLHGRAHRRPPHARHRHQPVARGLRGVRRPVRAQGQAGRREPRRDLRPAHRRLVRVPRRDLRRPEDQAVPGAGAAPAAPRGRARRSRRCDGRPSAATGGSTAAATTTRCPA